MRYCGLNLCDTSNGPGCRVSLFVSGCTLHCKGCFNPESWDFNKGEILNSRIVYTILDALKDPAIEGFSLLGGDPFEPEHKIKLLFLLRRIKQYFPNKTIWAWTGRTYDKIKESPLIEYIDVLIDGPFILSKLDPNLKYRGSTNQRVLQLHPFKDITNSI